MNTLRGYILLCRMEKDNEEEKILNDNILRIKKSLEKTAKLKKCTIKEKHNFMKNLLTELDAEEQKILRLGLKRDIESLNRGFWVKDLMVFAFSGISLFLNAISLCAKSTGKTDDAFFNIIWVVYIIIVVYLVALVIWITYLSKRICTTQQLLQIIDEDSCSINNHQ